MDAPAVGTTGVPPEEERPPYVAFFSTAIGATAGIRTFAGRRQTVPGVCFTVTAGSTAVKRGEQRTHTTKAKQDTFRYHFINFPAE